ncbi:3'-5' exonuclease [Nubsella zeaxanthinifaciens]|uniref:3'-5' exonuclease n=1 Tax=Nubsella zeaxanthinifaciens TaxID=392412 RepID=UPI000DE20523|nr:3'-5' exonuclease [Nubsella zeaxanthinifaciens]
MKHLMVDIETLGTTGRSVILSIAAVQFDIESGQVGDNFKMNVDVRSCTDVGLHFDPDCLVWWVKQDEKAKASVFESPSPLKDVLYEFAAFVKSMGDDVEIWSNGKYFDMALVRDAYAAINEARPWHYWNERDMRTLMRYVPTLKQEVPFTGIKHDPIDDCIYQIKLVVAIHRRVLKNIELLDKKYTQEQTTN